jgi:hypothetical protein
MVHGPADTTRDEVIHVDSPPDLPNIGSPRIPTSHGRSIWTSDQDLPDTAAATS